jgi:hypothetical protein
VPVVSPRWSSACPQPRSMANWSSRFAAIACLCACMQLTLAIGTAGRADTGGVQAAAAGQGCPSHAGTELGRRVSPVNVCQHLSAFVSICQPILIRLRL